MSRIVRTVRYTITCDTPGCGFTVTDSARVVVEQAWARHRQELSHLYCTTATHTTTGERP